MSPDQSIFPEHIQRIQDVLDAAVSMQGADSEAAKLLQEHINQLQGEVKDDVAEGRPYLSRELTLKSKQGAVIWVVLGGVVIIATMSIISLLIGMLAAKWLTL